MNISIILTRVAAIVLCLSLFAGCSFKPQKDDLEPSVTAPTKSTPPIQNDAASDMLSFSSDDYREQILEKYKYLDKHFQLMDNYGVESELKQSLNQLRGRPDIVRDVTQLYEVLTKAAQAEKHDYFGEARWRAVHLLGDLKNSDARRPLFEIATFQLPDPEKVGEINFGVEFRIRARAIDGLEKLKEVELLKKLYNKNNLLSSLAAASLYELGQAPKGVVALDGKKVFGLGDSTDFKVKERRIDKEHLKIPKTTGTQGKNQIVIPANTNNN